MDHIAAVRNAIGRQRHQRAIDLATEAFQKLGAAADSLDATDPASAIALDDLRRKLGALVDRIAARGYRWNE